MLQIDAMMYEAVNNPTDVTNIVEPRIIQAARARTCRLSMSDVSNPQSANAPRHLSASVFGSSNTRSARTSNSVAAIQIATRQAATPAGAASRTG